MTDVKPISPSQIKKWQTCQRQWGFVYLEGKREPGTASTELGTAVHAHLERAYKGQGYPNPQDRAGEIALAYLAVDSEGMRFLQTPDLCIEQPFEIGGRWRGVIDVLYQNTVRDHKTTSDLKWALTSDTLLTDPQGVIYAQSVFEDGYPDAHLQWHYVTTRPPYKTKKVHLTVLNDEEHQKRFARLEAINNTMQALHAKGAQAADLPRDESACNKFGGCFHRPYCNPSPVKAIDLNMEHPTTHPNPALERAKADGWETHPKSALWMFKPSDKKQIPVKVAELMATYDAVLKQEAAEAELPPALPEDDAPALPEVQAINPPAGDFVPPAPSEPAPAAPKPRPGRPPKAKPEPKETEAPIQPSDLKYVATHTHPEEALKEVGNMMPTSDIRVLYVDCIPMSFSRPTDVVRMLLDEACPAIEKANDVGHWKQIPYGGGTSALVIAARQVFTKTRGDLFLDTRTEEGSAVLSAAVKFITDQGGVVVRGLR